jgi:cytochrome c oxidase assembly protein subunit 11
MVGFGYALVPLYDVFCDITGLNGKTRGTAAVVTEQSIDTERTITVEFVASLNGAAPWEFAPKVTKLRVHPGEFYQTTFFARNLTDQPIVGQAIPSVAPGLAARHFQKIECFCFSRQAFGPGEGRDMPLVFRLDPAIAADISTVTLSYTFFEVQDTPTDRES